MTFRERFEAIIEKRGESLGWKLSLHTAWVSLLLFVFTYGYLMLTEPATLPVTANKASANTAMILIGLSFALSGLCYFWNFIDTKIVYRKYLGLAGFAFGLAHAVMSLIYYLVMKPRGYESSPLYVLDHVWDYGGFVISNLYAFALAVIALLIFAMMTAISNQYAIHELGGVWWRRLLRVGYVAYILATLHFLIKNIPEWQVMFATPEPELPPLNFMIFLLVCGVIGLRLALGYSLWKKSRATTATPSVVG